MIRAGVASERPMDISRANDVAFDLTKRVMDARDPAQTDERPISEHLELFAVPAAW